MFVSFHLESVYLLESFTFFMNDQIVITIMPLDLVIELNLNGSISHLEYMLMASKVFESLKLDCKVLLFYQYLP